MNKIKTLSCCAILQVFILVCCGQSIDRSVTKDVKTLQSKPIQLCLDSVIFCQNSNDMVSAED